MEEIAILAGCGPGAGKAALTNLILSQNQCEPISLLRFLSLTGPKILPFLPVSCLLHRIPKFSN